MAGATTNYGFTKPDPGEDYDLDLLNNNFDGIDARIKDRELQAKGIVHDKDRAAAANGITTLFVFDALSSYTYKAGRRYRIRWEFMFSQNTAGNVFDVAIQTCNPADSDIAITGLTQLVKRSVGPVVATGSPEFMGFEAYYKPGADTTVKTKFTVARSVGGGTMSISADPAYMYIEDLGDQF